MDFLLDPWSWWVEPFIDVADLRSGLIASLLVVIGASVIGTWVVIRGLSFFADALAHGVLPGVAVAFTLGGNIILGAIVAAILMIGGIRTVRKLSPLPNDVGIGILFVAMLALTLVIVGGGEEDAEELHEFLFGNVLEITNGDLIFQAITALVIVFASIVFYRALLATTFDSVLSKHLGLRPEIAEIGLLVLLALSIVASFKVVGSLLVFALLIVPPATAALILRKTWAIMLLAVGMGVFSVILGLLIGYHEDTSYSAVITLISVGIFFVVLIVRTITHNRGGQNKIGVPARKLKQAI